MAFNYSKTKTEFSFRGLHYVLETMAFSSQKSQHEMIIATYVTCNLNVIIYKEKVGLYLI